jgi:DNA-binding PadR family transcriptional regulator
MLKYTLLGFLNYQPMTGYELKQRMDNSTSHFWHAKLSQIYTTLKALEEDGQVTSNVEEQAERPDKRIYTITPAGQAELHRWLSQPEMELSPKKESTVLKLFFSAQLDKETILTQLRVQRDLHRQQLGYYHDVIPQIIQQAVAEFPGLVKDALLWEATHRFGEEYEALYIRWLEETIETIETKF